MSDLKGLSGAAYWLRARGNSAGASSTTVAKTGATSAKPARPSAADVYNDRMAPELRSALTVDVPLKARSDLRLLFVDHELMAALGMPVGKNGYLRPADEAALAAIAALEPATKDEATTTGVATRYADRHGWVQGDGRAVVIGTPQTERTLQAGAVVERPVNLRLKGVGTGLVPRGKDDKLHTTGKMGDDGALADTVISGFFAKNGIRTNRTLAFTGSQKLFDYQINGKTYQSTEGTLLLAGQFDRLGHLLQAQKSKGAGAVKQMLDDVNAQLCLELGRSDPLSLPAMYGMIVHRKARELADLWWLRSYQGSITYDNIGLFESIDHGTSETVDRTHKRHAFNPGCSTGYGSEPTYVLDNYIASELKTFFASAGGLADRARFAMLDAKTLARDSLLARHAENALEHVGFDLDVAARIMAQARPAALAFAQQVLTLADVVVDGAVHTVTSPHNDAWKTEVKDPARYDVMAALAALPRAMQRIAANDESGAVALVQRALSSLRPEEAVDAVAARSLIAAARPLYDYAFATSPLATRRAALDVAADVAARINAPVDGLMRFSVLPWVNDKLAAVKNGTLSVARFRGELNALVRGHQRRGDTNPGHIAQALRHGTLPVDERGRRVLSSVVENAVRIEERSDGVSDALVVSLAENPMELADPTQVKLELTFDDGSKKTLTSTGVVDGEVMFELPITGPASAHVVARFVADDGSGKRWDLDGFGFGNGHTLALSSAVVDAELGALAAADKRRRPRIDPNRVDAALFARGTARPVVVVDAAVAASFAARAPDAGGAPDLAAAFALSSGALGVPVVARGQVVVLAQGPAGAAYVIPPEILDVAEAQGRKLGRPVDDAHRDGMGRLVQFFERGRVSIDAQGSAEVQLAAKKPVPVSFDVDEAFVAAVAAETQLQDPVGRPFRAGAWSGQRFAASSSSWGDGWLFRGDDGFTHRVVRGFAMIYPAYKALLGAPLEDEHVDPAVADGVMQRFERGVLRWDPRHDLRVQLTD